MQQLQVYYRERKAGGSWSEEVDVAAELDTGQYDQNDFGHPTIAITEDAQQKKIFVAYVDERWYVDIVLEVRGNTFEYGRWRDQSYFISDSSDAVLARSTPFWSLNIVVTPDNRKYCFWEYATTNWARSLYFNSSLDQWDPDSEMVLYSGDDTLHQSKHVNACVSPDTVVHLVYSDLRPGQASEVFYMDKRPSDYDFGQYPGIQVSNSRDPINIQAEYPSCAYSSYDGVGYIHVVWSLNPFGQIQYRRLNLSTGQWTNIMQISAAGEPATRHLDQLLLLSISFIVYLS